MIDSIRRFVDKVKETVEAALDAGLAPEARPIPIPVERDPRARR